MARLFVGIELPQTLSAVITDLQKTLHKQDLFVGTYPTEDTHHITLAFLGEIEDKQVPLIAEALEKIHAPQLHARLDRLHTFSSDQRMREIYCAVHCPALADLVNQINRCLQPWTISEQRPVIAHITLARVNSIQDQRQLIHALEALPIPHTGFIINAFCLKQSTITTEGARHTTLQSYALE